MALPNFVSAIIGFVQRIIGFFRRVAERIKGDSPSRDRINPDPKKEKDLPDNLRSDEAEKYGPAFLKELTGIETELKDVYKAIGGDFEKAVKDDLTKEVDIIQRGAPVFLDNPADKVGRKNELGILMKQNKQIADYLKSDSERGYRRLDFINILASDKGVISSLIDQVEERKKTSSSMFSLMPSKSEFEKGETAKMHRELLKEVDANLVSLTDKCKKLKARQGDTVQRINHAVAASAEGESAGALKRYLTEYFGRVHPQVMQYFHNDVELSIKYVQSMKKSYCDWLVASIYEKKKNVPDEFREFSGMFSDVDKKLALNLAYGLVRDTVFLKFYYHSFLNMLELIKSEVSILGASDRALAGGEANG
ncbi:MAG: hypothetical protein ABH829_00515 [archaeon]